jgi:hypothetical protein
MCRRARRRAEAWRRPVRANGYSGARAAGQRYSLEILRLLLLGIFEEVSNSRGLAVR